MQLKCKCFMVTSELWLTRQLRTYKSRHSSFGRTKLDFSRIIAAPFVGFNSIWQLNIENTTMTYSINVLGVLFYGVKCGKLSTRLTDELDGFQNSFLRKSVCVFSLNAITNE